MILQLPWFGFLPVRQAGRFAPSPFPLCFWPLAFAFRFPRILTVQLFNVLTTFACPLSAFP
jgi:hypothetical protein